MSTKLDIAFWNYDRTRALADKTVAIEGVNATFHSGRVVTEIFERMVRDRAFDVAELGLSYYLRTLDLEDAPFLALPVFPVRCFRHSAIYVNTASGISGPADLRGKTVGELAMYGHDAGVWPKGILSDDYGVTPDQCRWVVGGMDGLVKPVDFVPLLHPAGVEIRTAPKGKELGEMLESGEIDALISADVPKCVLAKSQKVGRLFGDYESVERDYFRRTGIFPIMHAIVMRRDLAAAHPGLATSIYRGFCAAKDAAAQIYTKGLFFNNMGLMVPWLSRLIEENRELMGDDWWPYGMKANRKALDTFLRYHFEQGLSKRRMTCEEVFVPEVHST